MVSAIGDFMTGSAAHSAGKFSRRAMQINAVNRERDGVAETARIRDAARLHIGRQIAGLAQSGFQMTGTVFDAVRESEIEAKIDEIAARRRATSEAQAMRTQGELAYTQGYNQRSASYLSGAAKLVTTAVNYAMAGG